MGKSRVRHGAGLVGIDAGAAESRWPMGTSPAFCVLCGAFVVLSGALAGPDVPGRLPGGYDVRT